MRSESLSFETEDVSKISHSQSDDIPDVLGTFPSRSIAVASPFPSIIDITRENDLSLPSSYLDRYPNAALWNNDSIAPLESVAPGCRLEPFSVSFISTTNNTIKALLGAGIVALPMIFAEATLIPGILIFITAIVFSSLSFWLIGYLSHRTNHKSWGGMWKSILKHSKCNLPHWIKIGKPIDIVIIIANICNGCSYTLIATANIVNVYQDWFNIVIPPQPSGSNQIPQSQWEIENPASYLRRQWCTIILTFVFLFPMNFCNLRKVNIISILGILATLLLVLVVIFCGPPKLELDEDEKPELWNPSMQTIGCFAQFSIAVCAHSISPNFYQALEKRSPSRFAKTTFTGYAVILMMNLAVAICGYLSFGKKIAGQANILEAYSNKQAESSLNVLFVNIARICISISVLVNHSFQSRAFSTAICNVAPKKLLNHPFCVSNIDNTQKEETQKQETHTIKIMKSFIKQSSPYLSGNISPKVSIAKNELNPQNNEKGQLIIRIVYTFIVLIISLCVKRLKLLFKLTSPLISSSLVYTIPGSMLLFMGFLYTPKNKANERKLRLLAIIGAMMIILGLMSTALGLYTFIMYPQ